MTHETLMVFTKLFREVRFACVRGEPIGDELFMAAHKLLDGEETRAAEWLRYCCQTLRGLVREGSPTVYDFADTVHNAATLDGLEDGCLWLPPKYWNAEMQRFRDQYGQIYFEAFIGDVRPDDMAYPHTIEVHLRLHPAWRH